MTTKIRPVHEDDLPELMHLISGLARFHEDTPHVSLSDLKRDTLGPAPWFTVIVAEDSEGRLRGYAALIPMGQLQFGVRGMDLHHLFVRKGLRGQGVGSALVAACIARARTLHCQFLTVGTHPDNAKAGLFYETHGFIRRNASGPRFSMRLDSSDQPPT